MMTAHVTNVTTQLEARDAALGDPAVAPQKKRTIIKGAAWELPVIFAAIRDSAPDRPDSPEVL